MKESKVIYKKRKIKILFISSKSNYYIENCASFNRLYNTLWYFYKHKEFEVYVLQPRSDIEKEDLSLKDSINTYYFRALTILKLNLFPFIDFNIFFILKARKLIKKHQFDLVHVDFPYGINIIHLISNIPISYNSHNVEYIYTSQVGKYYSKLPNFLRHFYPIFVYLLEKQAIKSVQNINAISPNDREKFLKIYNVPVSKLIVNPLGYSKKIYQNKRDKNSVRNKLNIGRDKFVVIFHGAEYQNYANKEAVEIIKNEIAPNIADDDILFLIAGEMSEFQDTRNLRFLGFIKDLNDFIYSADIALAPILRGSGANVKIIDYLSGRIPVITTKKGVEGLSFKNGVHGYIVKNSAEEMIKKINLLKQNPNIVREFKRNIEELILNNLQWENSLKVVVNRYKSIVL